MSSQSDTIKIDTTRFGALEVSASAVISMEGGLIGFPGFLRFVLLDYNPPFSWLQSIDNADLAFVIVNGAEFGDDYISHIPPADRELEMVDGDDFAILNLVSVRPPPNETTANLKAPIVVNLKNMKGRQIVLDQLEIPMRFPLWGGATEGEKSNPEKK